MDAKSAFLVDYRLVKIRERWTATKVFDRRCTWAEPIEEAAVEALCGCFSRSGERDRIAAYGRCVVGERLGAERIGSMMRALLSGRVTPDG